jgi:hypothetical protein
METDTRSDINSGNNFQKNIPITANAPDSFSFIVDANSFNYAETHQVQISADSVSIGITITNYLRGSGKIVILDGSGSTIYEKDISRAMVSGEVIKLPAAPKSVNLHVSDFTGKIVLGLAGI